MKTSSIVASAIIALFVISAVSVVSAHSNSMFSSLGKNAFGGSDEDHSSSTTQQLLTQHDGGNNTSTLATTQGDGDGGNSDDGQDNTNQTSFPTLGQIISISNLTGTASDTSNGSFLGVATGSFTLKVTGVFDTGVVLTITSGHMTIGNSTINITSGAIVADRDGQSGSGTGTAGSASFLLHFENLPTLGLSDGGSIKLDLKTTTSEFLVSLASQVTSGDISGDSSGDSSGD